MKKPVTAHAFTHPERESRLKMIFPIPLGRNPVRHPEKKTMNPEAFELYQDGHPGEVICSTCLLGFLPGKRGPDNGADITSQHMNNIAFMNIVVKTAWIIQRLT